MSLFELSQLSCGSRAIGSGVLGRPAKDVGRELVAVLDCWHRTKTPFYEVSAVLHTLPKIADKVQGGVCWEVPPLPESDYLLPIPLLYLNKVKKSTSRQGQHWQKIFEIAERAQIFHLQICRTRLFLYRSQDVDHMVSNVSGDFQ